MVGVYTPKTEILLPQDPMRETYDCFQRVFDHFNWLLFESALPQCLITLQRKSRTYGYFSPKRFGNRSGNSCDEIAMNPEHFERRSAREVCSTLVHEMVHKWQYDYGKPGRAGYHNREWATKMKELGLQPSSTGRPGGAETGYKVSHYIIEDGPFDRAFRELEINGFTIEWYDRARQVRENAALSGAVKIKAPTGGKRTKYVCPECKVIALSSKNTKFRCDEHDLLMLPE